MNVVEMRTWINLPRAVDCRRFPRMLEPTSDRHNSKRSKVLRQGAEEEEEDENARHIWSCFKM